MRTQLNFNNINFYILAICGSSFCTILRVLSVDLTTLLYVLALVVFFLLKNRQLRIVRIML